MTSKISYSAMIRQAASFVALLMPAVGLCQTGFNIPSSLDQSAAVTSRGGHYSMPAGGPVSLPEDYIHLRLATGYGLHLNVFNAEDFSQDLTVDDNGSLSLSVIGEVNVKGDTIRAAEQKIAAAYDAAHVLVNPHVTLQITAIPQQPVTVSGEVQQPGKLPILQARPVLDLLAMAGGVTTAAGGEIEIRHTPAGGPASVTHIPYANGKEPSAAQGALVYPGDSIFVRRAGVIYTLGAVNRPGGYLMVNGGTMTLPQALSLAGGASIIASTSTAIVVRKKGDNVERIEVALKASEQGKQPPFALLDGDMVYIPTSKIKAALVNSSAVISSAASAGIYAATR